MKIKKANLIDKIEVEDYKEIVRIYKNLDNNGKSEFMELFTDVIQNENYEIRCKSLKVLPELSIYNILPPIIDAMENTEFSEEDRDRIFFTHKPPATEEENFKDSIVRTLIDLNKIESIQMLMDLYEEQKDPVKQEIIIYIFKKLEKLAIKEFENIFFKEDDKEIKTFIIKLMGQINNQSALKLLLTLFNDLDPELKKEIIFSLDKFDSSEIVPLLIKSLRERNSEIVDASVKGLSKYFEKEEVIQNIIDEIKQSDDREREEIIKYISLSRKEEVVPLLLEEMNVNNRAIKLSIIEAFRDIKYKKYPEKVVNRLTAELKNEDLRWDVLLTLEVFSPAEALPHLIELLEKEDPECRKYAKRGEKNWECRKIITRILGNIGSPEAVPVLIKALDGNQYFNRLVKQQTWEILIETLAKIASPDTIPYLIKSILEDPKEIYIKSYEGLIKAGKSAVPELIKTYKKKPANRKRIIDLLGEIKDEKGCKLIIDACSDRSKNIRKSAVIAIGKMDCEEQLSILKKALKDDFDQVRLSALKILDEKGHKDISIFIEVLKDKEAKIRQAAKKILIKIESPELKDCLNKLLEENSSDIKIEIEEILEKIEEKNLVLINNGKINNE